MHRASRVEQGIVRLRDNHNTSVRCFGYVLTECPRDRVQGQSPVRETLNKLKAAHLFLPGRADGAINSICYWGHRCLLPWCQDWARGCRHLWPSESCHITSFMLRRYSSQQILPLLLRSRPERFEYRRSGVVIRP